MTKGRVYINLYKAKMELTCSLRFYKDVSKLLERLSCCCCWISKTGRKENDDTATNVATAIIMS